MFKFISFEDLLNPFPFCGKIVKKNKTSLQDFIIAVDKDPQIAEQVKQQEEQEKHEILISQLEQLPEKQLKNIATANKRLFRNLMALKNVYDAFKDLSYEKQVPLYLGIREKIPVSIKEQIEQHIRATRREKEKS